MPLRAQIMCPAERTHTQWAHCEHSWAKVESLKLMRRMFACGAVEDMAED